VSISILAGDPGNGKGVLAMSFIEQAVLSGRQVYTNIQLREACPYFDRVALIDDPAGNWPVYRGTPAGRDHKGRMQEASDDYMAFWHYVQPGSIVMVDEADAYFDCTDHSTVGQDIRLFHKQHRKLGVDMIYIVQNISNFYIRIRRLAQRFMLAEWNWRSMRFFQNAAQWIGQDRAMAMTRFLRAEFRSEDFSERSYIGGAYVTYGEAKRRFFNWYYTEQILGDTTHLRWAKDLPNSGLDSSAAEGGAL
jgi:hypothetical protein